MTPLTSLNRTVTHPDVSLQAYGLSNPPIFGKPFLQFPQAKPQPVAARPTLEPFQPRDDVLELSGQRSSAKLFEPLQSRNGYQNAFNNNFYDAKGGTVSGSGSYLDLKA